MKAIRISSFCAALAVLGLVVLAGCSKQSNGTSALDMFPRLNPFAPNGDPSPPDSIPRPDSIPGPSPSPPPIVVVPVQFLGADSMAAGQSGNTYWRLGNDGNLPFTMRWTLDVGPGWPGDPWPAFPIAGDQFLPPFQTRDITVPIAVPASAFTGNYPLRMTVTRPGGLTTTTDGQIRVFDGSPPPPPPPPPTPAVVFAGYDSMPQPTITFWGLHNEADAPFTMDWSLASTRNWPGFPIQGSQALSSLGFETIAVTIPIPDSAAAGINTFVMTVTRPNGLPPQSADGWIPIVE